MQLTLFLAVQNLKLLPAFFDWGGELDCRQYNGMPAYATNCNFRKQKRFWQWLKKEEREKAVVGAKITWN